MKMEQFYLEIINNLCDGIYFVDMERRILLWNKAAESITGYKEDEIVGKCCQENILNHIDREGKPLCLLGCPLYATTIDGCQRKDEVFLRHKDGHRIPVLVNIFPMYENGEIIGAIEVFTPNSPIVYDDDLIERLSDLAMNDQLTGLSNRRKMESFLDYKFNEYKRFHSKFCVVFLDIDSFSSFNNTYGHETGDEVLRAVSKSVRHSLRQSDLFGRWGGEEFIGVFSMDKDYEASIIAEKIRVLIEGTQIPCGEEFLSVTASIGVTVVNDSDNIDSIVKRADTLMYQSKQKGKNCVTFGV